MSRIIAVIFAIAAIAFFRPAAAGEEKIKVFVSIVPQEYFIGRVGGERVQAQALVKPGSSPATYEPTPRQMVELSQAKLFFRIGVAFENSFLPKIEQTLPNLKIIDTRAGINLREMKAHHHDEDGEEHEKRNEKDEHAEHEEGHHHEGTDPHIWLSPRLVKVQTRTMADALIALDPEGKEVYETNYQSFAAELDALDQKLASALASVKGKTFLVFHPAWGYFADAYGLNQEPIEIEGKDPSAQQLARIIDQAKAEDVRVIFVQPQFSQATAKSVASAINGAVVPIDPLARDYVKNLEAVAKTVSAALGAQKK
jgi:zinc transport system substrate-binding protein